MPYSVFFDHNASTPLAPEAQAAMIAALQHYGNPSSQHRLGRTARSLLQQSRDTLLQCLHAPSSARLIFTSGGTEALNLALQGIFTPSAREAQHLIVSTVEHDAVLKNASLLAQRGVEVSYIDVDARGRLDPERVEAALRPHTRMIAVMFANNETGNLYAAEKIGALARKRRALYLCDAVQAVGKLQLDLQRLPIDMLAASAHKFHGPKGAGFLYLAPGVELTPLQRGGRQERGYRPGTENTPAICGMAKALEVALQHQAEDEQKIAGLRDRLQRGLLERIEGVVIHGDPEHRLANTLHFRIEGICGETLLMNLDLAGVCASVGAACESGSLEPSHVLLAMGLDPKTALGGLRFSLARNNCEADIDYVLEVLPKLVVRMRSAA